MGKEFRHDQVEPNLIDRTLEIRAKDGWSIVGYSVSHCHPQHTPFHHFIFEREKKDLDQAA